MLLKTNTMSGAYDLQVAMDGNGNTVAVWVEDDSNSGVVYSRRYVWMNRYFVDTGKWGLSIMMPAVSSEDMFNPQVVLDGKGNATIVGAVGNSGNNRLWISRYDFIHDTFSVPAYFTMDLGINLKLAADRDGNELCVYIVADGHSTLRALAFNAETAVWQTAKQVSGSGWSGGHIKLAANRNDNAVAVWAQSDGLTYHLWASVLN